MASESQVPQFLDKGMIAKMGANIGALLTVEPPRIVAADGLAFDDRPGIRKLQNCAAAALYVKIGEEAIAGADDFHFILAACTDVDDGIGSQLDLSRFRGQVWIKAASGVPRVAAFAAYTPNNQPT